MTWNADDARALTKESRERKRAMEIETEKERIERINITVNEFKTTWPRIFETEIKPLIGRQASYGYTSARWNHSHMIALAIQDRKAADKLLEWMSERLKAIGFDATPCGLDVCIE